MIRTGIAASIVIVVVMMGFSVYGWHAIPPETLLPRHWGFDGRPDGFSPRNHVLIGLPAAAVIASAIFAVAPLMDPRRDNIRSSGGLLLAMWIGILGILAVAHAAIVMAGLSATRGVAVEIDPRSLQWIVASAAIFVVWMGNFLGKSRSNFFVGVRTPWSLSSENAWSRANRVAGWLMVLSGFISIILTFAVSGEVALKALFTGVVVAAVFGVAISYVVWRSEQRDA